MPNSIQTILVPTDFSENSASAYPLARRLAEAFDAKIVLTTVSDVSIFPIGIASISWESITDELVKDAESKLPAEAEAFAGLEVETVIRQGRAVGELLAVAREKQADVIVMGTHGHSGLMHALIGSTAERVVRQAPCPVLTVHPDPARGTDS